MLVIDTITSINVKNTKALIKLVKTNPVMIAARIDATIPIVN
ncbi:hypothetical protein Aeq9CBH6_24470 [Adlercreutzia equolifaciens]|nr:hypothetical protein Aeq9CBH6_24470 [Adlercreutzia equolifaciens]